MSMLMLMLMLTLMLTLMVFLEVRGGQCLMGCVVTPGDFAQLFGTLLNLLWTLMDHTENLRTLITAISLDNCWNAVETISQRTGTTLI